MFWNNCTHLTTKDQQWHQLEDEKFLEKIKDLEGTPKEFFEQKMLVDLYLPIIRNDFKIFEQYQFKERVKKLIVDMSIMIGDKETFKDTVLEWEKYTLGKCNFYEFNGGHFFLFEHIHGIAELVNETLKSYLAIKNGFITGGN